MCVVHLLAQGEEPAQRPGCSLEGASWVGSVMWVFGFVPILELGCLASSRSTAALRRSLATETRVSGGIAGVDGNRTNAPLFSPRLPRSIRYSKPDQAVLILTSSRRHFLRKFWTVTLSLAFAGSAPNCR